MLRRGRYLSLLILPCLALDATSASGFSSLFLNSSQTSFVDHNTFSQEAFSAASVSFTQSPFVRSLYSKWTTLLRRTWGEDEKQPPWKVITKWVTLDLAFNLAYYHMTDDWAHKYPERLLATFVPIGFVEAWASWRIEQRIEKMSETLKTVKQRLTLTIPYALFYIAYVSVIEGMLYELMLPGLHSVFLRTTVDILFLSPLVMDPLAAFILHRLARKTQEEAMQEIRDRLAFFYVYTSPAWFGVSLAVNWLSTTNPILSYIILSIGIVGWCTVFAFANRNSLYQWTQQPKGFPSWLAPLEKVFQWWGRVAYPLSRPLNAIYGNRFFAFMTRLFTMLQKKSRIPSVRRLSAYSIRIFDPVAWFLSKPVFSSSPFLRLDFGLYLRYLGAGLPTLIMMMEAWLLVSLEHWIIITSLGGLTLVLGIRWLWDYYPNGIRRRFA